MLSKLKGDQTKSRSGQRKKFKLFAKMTRSTSVSPYQRMESDGKKKKSEDKIKDKENIGSLGNKEVKEKKKRENMLYNLHIEAF
ncbi:hypothetical protein TNCT_432841 [Trichonephila clavata]|uniref:Uncharacterized protein n=1 Tax=Trichonephila clavata TaxID=2740835 RepID=A0A8X6JDF0_TRICU|nr:hypothetical protein TNCT_432841 [Trichonephila clavata]